MEVVQGGGEDRGGERAVPALVEEVLGRAERSGVVVAGDEEPGGVHWRGEDAEIHRAQGGGDRQVGASGAKGERGFDALGDEEGVSGWSERHGAAMDAPEGFAGLGDVGRGGAMGVEVGAVHAGELAGVVGEGGDEGGQLAVRVVGVAVEQGAVESQGTMAVAVLEPAGLEIRLGVRAVDGTAQIP